MGTWGRWYNKRNIGLKQLKCIAIKGLAQGLSVIGITGRFRVRFGLGFNVRLGFRLVLRLGWDRGRSIDYAYMIYWGKMRFHKGFEWKPKYYRKGGFHISIDHTQNKERSFFIFGWFTEAGLCVSVGKYGTVFLWFYFMVSIFCTFAFYCLTVTFKVKVNVNCMH